MKREIKFRVWSNVRKCWAENSLLLACIDGLPFIHFVEVDNEKTFVKHHVYNASNLELDIQRYTGLKDKNGKEIYEGDIVKDQRGIVGQVCWISEAEGWDWSGWHYGNASFPFEVIGNIHENPELLNENVQKT